MRSPEKAARSRELGCELVAGTLATPAAIASGDGGLRRGHPRRRDLRGRHPQGRAPGDARRQRARHRARARAALEAGIPRVVYVSTIAVFGNTDGKVVDETYEHPGDDFTSYYEETKYEAHQVARRMIETRACPA